jgi:hypothetical protein
MSTVEASGAVEAAAIVEVVATVVAASSIPSTVTAGVWPAVSLPSISASMAFMPIAPSAAGVRLIPAIVPPTAAIPIAMVIAVVPRAGSDEDSVHEIARSVVAVGRAGVRRIIVVAVVTNRRPRNIRMPNHNAYGAHSDSD